MYCIIAISCCVARQMDPNLWVQALAYFAGKEDDSRDYIAAVLSRILRQ